MSEQRDTPPEYQQVADKLLLLYLIDKMDLPLTRGQITEFVREGEYMDYYTLQQTLADMVDGGYLEMAQDNNHTRYTITEDGTVTLEYLDKHIPAPVRAKINKYVNDNRKSVKRDFEIVANAFPNQDNSEIIVKCGVYDDDCMLMEINVSVDSRDQAKLICNNWRAHVNVLYGAILNQLIDPPPN